MSDSKCKINPWLVLLLQRYKARNDPRTEWLWEPLDVDRAVRRMRKDFLGSGLSIEMFIRENGKPNDEAIRELGKYLSDRTAAFLHGEGWGDICDTFYHYSLYMMASGQICEECIDDLIQLGDCYEKCPETFALVGETLLENEMLQDLREWVIENDLAPSNFGRAVLGAVAVLTGVLPDPLEAKK